MYQETGAERQVRILLITHSMSTNEIPKIQYAKHINISYNFFLRGVIQSCTSEQILWHQFQVRCIVVRHDCYFRFI